jgi:hypothetical protein
MRCEQVQVIERQFGVFPAKFTWGNRIVTVDTVERCWTEMKRCRGQALYHFRVRCGAERYRLSEDARSGTWTMQPERPPT